MICRNISDLPTATGFEPPVTRPPRAAARPPGHDARASVRTRDRGSGEAERWLVSQKQARKTRAVLSFTQCLSLSRTIVRGGCNQVTVPDDSIENIVLSQTHVGWTAYLCGSNGL